LAILAVALGRVKTLGQVQLQACDLSDVSATESNHPSEVRKAICGWTEGNDVFTYYRSKLKSN
jgi:hypothetical protein